MGKFNDLLKGSWTLFSYMVYRPSTGGWYKVRITVADAEQLSKWNIKWE